MDEQKTKSRKKHNEPTSIASSDLDKIINSVELNMEYNPYTIQPEGVNTHALFNDYRDDGTNLIILDKSPFYQESGGQVSDTGKLVLLKDNSEFQVIGTDVFKNNVIIGNPQKINIEPKTDKLKAFVNFPRRQSIQRNH